MLAWTNKTLAMFLAALLAFGGPCFAQISAEDQHFLDPQYSKRISMDFKDASLSDVLKIFSKQAGKNFIATEDLGNKRLTLFFENIPVEEALEKILKANDLEYEEQPGSDIIIVRPAIRPSVNPLITRVYHLKHASVPASKLFSTITPGGASSSSSLTTSASGGGGSAPSAVSSGASGSSSAGGAGTGYAAGIYAAVKAAMSKSGILIEDARTNSFVVTDVKSQFPLIEETIKKLDVSVPQILIQVEMLDISKTTSDLLGVKWGQEPFVFNGAAKSSLLPFDQSALLQKLGTGGLQLSDTSGSGSSGGSSGGASSNNPAYIGGAYDFRGLSAIVNFLKTQSDTRSLARPRLLTLNNETAEIKISTDEAIGVTENNFGSTSATQSAVEAERYQTGVFLTVTPQADMVTREILMAVAPKVIETRAGDTFDGHTFRDPEERGTQSLLKVKDGDTIIIGGLLRDEKTNTITKVPFLSDLPLIGAAFRHKDKTTSKRELIIFLTPYIIDDASASLLLHPATHRTRSDAINKTLSILEKQRS